MKGPSVHIPPGVSYQPLVHLRNWRVLEVLNGDTKERHLVGYSTTDQEGRVSSRIREFDPSVGICVTRSGRQYRLIGPPSVDWDGDRVWQALSRMKAYCQERDVTEEYASLMRRHGMDL